MILYLDTSSLVKLYIEETHSHEVRSWVERADIVATCRVAYPEMMSALTRRYKAGDISKKVLSRLIDAFIGEWLKFVVLDFDETVAGELARRHNLRGLDAIHLSSLKLLSESDKNLNFAFSSFDERLNRAATREGFNVLTP